ncbi:hypothetical protein ACFLZR_00515 [Candidatus Neomarinimicrobiota bacterium]
MDLKDKLNIIWKYLALAVVVFAIVMLAPRSQGNRGYFARGFRGAPSVMNSPVRMPLAQDMRVEQQINNGDTTLVIWVNGEQIDNPEDFMQLHMSAMDSLGPNMMRMAVPPRFGPGRRVMIEMHADDIDEDDD